MRRVSVAVLCFLLFVTGGGLVAADDHDGVPLRTELQGATDPFNADSDADDLGDGAERNEYATSPRTADTDTDGVTDGREVATTGTDPIRADTDADGVDDGTEVQHGLKPTAPDTDGDTLVDGAERATYGTDPTAVDTDGDALGDAVELTQQDTDPINEDTDGDSLTDSRELAVGSDPTVADTDGEGLADGVEVTVTGSDPTVVDTDADLLADAAERTHNTNATTADTDRDGFRDGVEVYATGALADADPLHKDVFLELDYMANTTVPAAKLDRVQQTFASAPVSNPDGERGITLHIRVDDAVTPEGETSLRGYLSAQYQTTYDYDGYGYYHGLLVPEVHDLGSNANTVGITSTAADGFLTEARPNTIKVAKNVMHELGHQLGLTSGDHTGIDSYTLKPNTYPSVMNYHWGGRCDCHYNFSDGSHGTQDFDDWGHIVANLPSNAPDRHAVTTLIPDNTTHEAVTTTK